METCRNKIYTGAYLPAIGFGTGVVRKYTRNSYLFAKFYIRCLLSSIKHMRIHQQFDIDWNMPKMVSCAAQEGYRFFDSGRIYAYSESSIAKGLEKVGIAREECFLVTKVSDMDVERPYSPNTVEGNLRDSLHYLNTDYVDAYLLHWPHGDWLGIYRQMEDVYRMGLARAIGVCNFEVQHFRLLEKECKIRPMICQLELHPFRTRQDVRRYCAEHGIVIMAHTPTGRMCDKIRNNPILQELSSKYGKTVAQIILRWHYQNGIVPVVATRSSVHIQENKNIFDFEISTADMEQIEMLNEDYVMLVGNGIDDPNYIYNL